MIATEYIPLRRILIPRAEFDVLQSQNFPVYLLGDINNGNFRQLGDKKINHPGEKIIEIDGWNHLDIDCKTHHHQGSGTSDEVM